MQCSRGVPTRAVQQYGGESTYPLCWREPTAREVRQGDPSPYSMQPPAAKIWTTGTASEALGI